MNTKNFLILISTVILSSCVPSYYQVYKVDTDKEIKHQENNLIYEDKYCKVSYDLWQQDGTFRCNFYNKTDSYIYLDLEKSFFILNDFARSYYLGGINEQKILIVPSKTFIVLPTEFSINNELIRDCDLLLYPTKSQIKSLSYNESNSPLRFSNMISFNVENSTDIIELKNSFFVSEITNYPGSEMLSYKNIDLCNQKTETKTAYFTKSSPDKFYLKYTKSADATNY